MLRLRQITSQLRGSSIVNPIVKTTSSIATMSTSTSIPSKMRAVQIMKQGGLDVLEDREADVPKPGPNDILIKVNKAGVNFIDTYQRSGLYKIEKFPYTLGQEAAGKVVAVGESQKGKGLEVGDRAITYFGGSFAEYVSVPRARITKVPDAVNDTDAVASCVQGLTAWTLVRETYSVKKGDWVLVHAAAGGVGLLLCQMAKHLGAHVIGTTSSEEKAEEAKKNGAEHMINYAKENTVERVLEITNGQGVQAIFDGVGKDTWEDDFKMIARKGTIATFGNASGAVEPFAPLKLAGKNVKVARPTLVNYVYTQEEFETTYAELFDLIAKGIVKFKIHGEYNLSAQGIRQAQEDITSRKTSGKLIVNVA